MSSALNRVPLAAAENVARWVVADLSPHCERIEIAGSIRRRRPLIGDIEIVCVPKPYDAEPLFRSGIAQVVEQWPKVKGEMPCRYTQRLLTDAGMTLDLFMVDPRGWGLQLAIRTGSARWSHEVLARAWVKAGYKSEDGLLRYPDGCGTVRPVYSERELFDLIGLPWVDPRDREVQP
jgi:DNA polymerase/3'-5' exonuclease PolX